MTLSKKEYERKREINNKLTAITLAADKLEAHRNEIYKLVNELKIILDDNS